MIKGHAAIGELTRQGAVNQCKRDSWKAACKYLADNTVAEVLAEFLRVCAEDHDDDHDHDHDDHAGEPTPRPLGGLAAVMVPFGAAASPDLTILPVFLAATTAGVATAVGSVVIFAAVTIGTIVGLTLAAARGGYQIQGEWLERWGNVFTAAVLCVIGLLVLLGVI
jgi:putative Mn2+ efflux pump MntP